MLAFSCVTLRLVVYIKVGIDANMLMCHIEARRLHSRRY